MKKRVFKVLFLITLLIVLPINIKAVTFTVTKSKDNMKPGEDFSFVIKASDFEKDEKLSGYRLTIDYDVSKVEFAGDAGSNYSNVSSDGGKLTITNKSELNQKSEFEVAKVNMRVKGNAGSGTTNLTLGGSCNSIIDDGAVITNNGSCNYRASTVTIKALSNDSNLSSLNLSGFSISPAFDSGVTNYKASVKDVTSVTIEAKAADANAKVEGTGARNISKGDNKLEVKVTSEDGNSSKVYTINVSATMSPTDEELKKADATLKELKIKGQELEFDPTEKKYYLSVNNDITKLEITATPTNDKAKVKVENNNKINVGKNTIKITVTSEDGTKTEDYQIIVTRKEKEKEVVKTCPNMNNMSNWTSYIWVVLSVATAVMFTLGIVLGYILGKHHLLGRIFKKKEKKEEPVAIETLSNTIDLSDTINQINNK
ncbi:MAG: cadherin-like beta sandwich domain-containing protein [Bacilli bacterium]|nr:cadherin-like beta sandwich domain-containing protein [Bacilli bacterium]